MTQAAGPRITGINHFSATVTDLEASVAWYQRLFGLDRVPFDFRHYEREETGYGIVLMDPQVQYSVTCSSIVQKKTDDGRLQVTAYLQNRETRRIQVQVNCVFKDLQGMPTEGEETPFRNLILTENAQEPLIFTALNTNAEGCTIRVRQAH